PCCAPETIKTCSGFTRKRRASRRLSFGCPSVGPSPNPSVECDLIAWSTARRYSCVGKHSRAGISKAKEIRSGLAEWRSRSWADEEVLRRAVSAETLPRQAKGASVASEPAHTKVPLPT